MTLGLDFGTSNTVVVGRSDDGTVRMLHAETVGRRIDVMNPMTGTVETANIIPSLIHYDEAGVTIGSAIPELGPDTFRWLKLDMLRNPNRNRRVGERLVAYKDAASRLVSGILRSITDASPKWIGSPITVSVPVGCPDEYSDWLVGVVENAGFGLVSVVDEATATILGAFDRLEPDALYAIIDIDAKATDVSIVRPDVKGGDRPRCRVLATAHEDVGGASVDQWILESLDVTAADRRAVGSELLKAIEEAKHVLSYENQAVISVYSKESDSMLTHNLDRDRFEEILLHNQFVSIVDRTIERALLLSENTYGIHAKDLTGVIVVGWTNLISCLGTHLSKRFGDRLSVANPFSTVAWGACRFSADSVSPILVHDYFVKAWDDHQKRDTYLRIMGRGQTFPTTTPVKVVDVSATHKGQTRLGIEVFELSETMRLQETFTITSDGCLQLSDDAGRELKRHEPLNPGHRDFLLADPPCVRGERRFRLAFGLDAEKRLTLSVTDHHPNGNSKLIMPNGDKLPLPIKGLPFIQLNA